MESKFKVMYLFKDEEGNYPDFKDDNATIIYMNGQCPTREEDEKETNSETS